MEKPPVPYPQLSPPRGATHPPKENEMTGNDTNSPQQETIRRNGGRTRFPLPYQLTGATAFSQSGEIRNPLWLAEAYSARTACATY